MKTLKKSLEPRLSNKNKIILNDHQKYVSEYMLNKCSNQNGLILFHMMGTGKTISSLNFIRNIKKNINTTVVCPDQIKEVWKKEINKLQMSKYKINILSYQEFIKMNINRKRENNYLIIDEAHNLLPFLYKNDEISSNIYDKCLQYEKKILLSGTPVYSEKYDICHLLNIATDSKNFPTNDNLFYKKFGKKRYFKGIFIWLIDFLINTIFLIYLMLVSIKILLYLFKINYINKTSIVNFITENNIDRKTFINNVEYYNYSTIYISELDNYISDNFPNYEELKKCYKKLTGDNKNIRFFLKNHDKFYTFHCNKSEPRENWKKFYELYYKFILEIKENEYNYEILREIFFVVRFELDPDKNITKKYNEYKDNPNYINYSDEEKKYYEIIHDYFVDFYCTNLTDDMIKDHFELEKIANNFYITKFEYKNFYSKFKSKPLFKFIHLLTLSLFKKSLGILEGILTQVYINTYYLLLPLPKDLKIKLIITNENKKLGFNNFINDYLKFVLLICIGIYKFFFSLFINKIHIDRKKLNNVESSFFNINFKKLIQCGKRYISYSDIPESLAEHFPQTQIVVQNHSYNMFQNNMFINFVKGNLTQNEIQSLHVFDSNDYNIKFESVLGEKALNNVGLKIGNVGQIVNFKNLSKKGYQYYLKDKINNISKFDFILKNIQNNKKKKIAIYSNFENCGGKLLSAYLSQNNIKNVYLEKDKMRNVDIFNKSKDTNVIILHPDYTEGLNLIGVRYFHLLEPINILSKYEQVIARVKRFHSHSHYAEEDRNCIIYVHRCKANMVMNKFISLKKWFTDIEIWRSHFYRQHAYAYFKFNKSPDQIIYNKLKTDKRNKDKILKIFTNFSAENITNEELKENKCKRNNYKLRN